MARKISVEIVGSSESLERSFKRSQTAAKSFDREIGRTTRGLAAGSGAFRGLGRSVAFASGAFIGAAGVTQVIRSSVDAALQGAATQRQLAAQFKATGMTLGPYRKQIADTSTSLSALSGFTRDELEQSFITAFRATKNVSEALKIEAIAADVARGRHIGLAQSTLALSKGVTQNATALKRLGIEIPKNVTGFKLLEYVQRKFAGQAVAGATSQDRLRAAIHNLEESAGTALLPTINKVANAVAAWAGKSENQARVQRDVADVLDHVKSAADAVSDAFKIADKVTGNFTNTLKILLTLGAAGKLLKMAGALGVLEATAAAGGAAGAGFARGAPGFLGAAGLGAGADAAIRTKTPVGGFGLSGGATRGAGGLGGLFGSIGKFAGATFGAIPDQGPLGPLGDKDGVFKMGRKWYIVARGGKVVVGPLNRDPRLANLNAAGAVASTSGADTPGPHNVPARIDASLRKKNGDPAAWMKLIVPYRLRLEAARAAVTGTLRDDVTAAKDEKRWLTKLIGLGRLRGQGLIDAYTALGQVNATIAQAQVAAAQEAARKAKAAKEAARRRLDDARRSFHDASVNFRDTFRNAVADAQNVIGPLFQGPVLAPTDQQLKARLGVKYAGTSPGTLTHDLNAQVAQATRFFNDLKRLRKRGAPQALIDQLQAAGLADAPEAHALAGASPKALRGFLRAFGRDRALAAKVAIRSPTVTIAARQVTVAGQKLTAAGGKPPNVYVYIDGVRYKPRKVSATQRRGRNGGTP